MKTIQIAVFSSVMTTVRGGVRASALFLASLPSHPISLIWDPMSTRWWSVPCCSAPRFAFCARVIRSAVYIFAWRWHLQERGWRFRAWSTALLWCCNGFVSNRIKLRTADQFLLKSNKRVALGTEVSTTIDRRDLYPRFTVQNERHKIYNSNDRHTANTKRDLKCGVDTQHHKGQYGHGEQAHCKRETIHQRETRKAHPTRDTLANHSVDGLFALWACHVLRSAP